MKKQQLGYLVKECRWRIEGVLKSGGTVADICRAAKVSNSTIYSYLGCTSRQLQNGRPDIAQRILAVFGARISITGNSVKVRETL